MQEFNAIHHSFRASLQANNLGYSCEYSDGFCHSPSDIVVPRFDHPNLTEEAIVLPSTEVLGAKTLFN